MPEYSATRSFDLAIPSTVTTGTPVDVSTAADRFKTLILPPAFRFRATSLSGRSRFRAGTRSR